jgi:F-type H+-transporting ATPase subunit gamma
MAGLKDIKRRIKSVKNTRKTTYAMKLVSAAKLRKAQDAVLASRAYADTISELVSRLSAGSQGEELSHPLMKVSSEVQRVLFVVVGASRGLCGGYNANIDKAVRQYSKACREKYAGVEIDFLVFGKKPAEALKKLRIQPVQTHLDLPDSVALWPLEETGKFIERSFLDGHYQEVRLIYTRFRSPVSMNPVNETLLPMSPEEAVSEADDSSLSSPTAGGTQLLEPSASQVFEATLPRILRIKLQQACMNAKAGEHGSRMVAMDNATKNAGELAKSLTLLHNRLRQSAITGELLDIVGGAEALK